jgi:hypothetical protein
MKRVCTGLLLCLIAAASPRIESVRPDGYLPGRTLFTISGSDFQPGSTVSVSSILPLKPRVNVVSSGRIEVVLDPGMPPGDAVFKVRNADGAESGSVRVASRPLQMHLIFHTHLDIGYTAPVAEVAAEYKSMFDRMVKLIETDQPPEEDTAIRFTVETLWQLEQYLARSKTAEVNRFMQLVRRGRIEVCAGYNTANTSAISYEELNRILYPAARYRAKYGIPIETLMLNDQPGYTWGLADAAVASGVRYFLAGVNLFNGQSFPGNPFPVNRRPFYWVGRSGAKLLTWISVGEQDYGGKPWDPNAYKCEHCAAYTTTDRNFGLLLIDPDKAPPGHDRARWDKEHFLERVLRGFSYYADRDYPYGDLLVMAANGDNNRGMRWGFGDHFEFYRWAADGARHLNAMKTTLRATIATPTPFFKEMERLHRDFAELPAAGAPHGGDWPSTWEAGDAAAGLATARVRKARESMVTAEKFSALRNMLGAQRPAPLAVSRQVWRLIREWDDHTSPHATVQMGLDRLTQHESEHLEFASQAAAISERALQDGLKILAAALAGSDQRRVFVFNPTSWTRTAPVWIDAAVGGRFNLRDLSTGETLTGQRVGARLAFVARDVPANGYRTYALLRAGELAAAKGAPGGVIDNTLYRVMVDANGNPAEIFDRELKRNLIDSGSPYGFLVPAGINRRAARDNGFGLAAVEHEQLVEPATSIRTTEDGPVVYRMVIEKPRRAVERLEITLYAGVKRVDFTLDMELNNFKRLSYRQNNMAFWNLPFPFALDPGRMKLLVDTASGYLDPYRDSIPGTYNDTLFATHGVSVADDALRVDLGCLESFLWDLPTAKGLLASVGGAGNGLERPPLVTLLSQLRGQLRLSYTLRSGPPSSHPAEFLSGVNNDLVATVVAAGAGRAGLPPSASLLRLDRRDVEVTAFKAAEAGTGCIIRLRDLSGKGGPVRIASDVFRIVAASRATMTEETEPGAAALPVSDGAASIELRPFETATILVGSYAGYFQGPR